MNRKNYLRHIIGYLLVWICSGIVFYSYQVNNKYIGLLFTFISALYFLIVYDKE